MAVVFALDHGAAHEHQFAGFAHHFNHRVERRAQHARTDELAGQFQRDRTGRIAIQQGPHRREQRDVHQREGDRTVDHVEQVGMLALRKHPQAAAPVGIGPDQHRAHRLGVKAGGVGQLPAEPAGIGRIGLIDEAPCLTHVRRAVRPASS